MVSDYTYPQRYNYKDKNLILLKNSGEVSVLFLEHCGFSSDGSYVTEIILINRLCGSDYFTFSWLLDCSSVQSQPLCGKCVCILCDP